MAPPSEILGASMLEDDGASLLSFAHLEGVHHRSARNTGTLLGRLLYTANLAAVEPQEFATSSVLGPFAVLFTTQQPELPHLVKIIVRGVQWGPAGLSLASSTRHPMDGSRALRTLPQLATEADVWIRLMETVTCPCLFGNFCILEVLHLLPQLRIYLVRDGHNVRKQCTEFQILHVVVQRRKNADLQQSRLLYQHLYWVALSMPQFPMVGRSL